ncbi:MAG TPA: hypothetical protein VHB21_09895 [Minicystis sp.]|nr:hypothetical protein [Minicystis sp.]
MSSNELTAESLFLRAFAPLYPREALADLAAVRRTDANPAENPAVLAQLAGAAAAFAHLAAGPLGAPRVALDFSDRSVHEISARLTRERRDAWLAARAGETSLLVKLAIHGALYVGACVVKNHGGRWLVRRPTWESLVELQSAAGTAELAPFAWWLKALSDAEVGAGRLADRYRTHVEVPTFDASALAVIAPPDRRIPRLAKVRYDTLHQHLRAHLPELKDVGADFPSPERFAEIGFRALDFTLVGGGRMLLMHGAGATGVHLYWLDAAGFVKAAYLEADAFPAPVVEVLPAAGGAPERVRVVVSVGGSARTHEMLWWGA